MKQSALVTGATGFLGGRLAGALVADGWEVHALVRPRSDLSLLPAGVKAVVVPATARELAALMPGLAPQVVFHLATCFRGTHTDDDVEPLVEANVLFGTQLAQALVAAPPSVLVNVGSAWQNGEDGEYSPAALYAATKQAMEDIFRYYAESGAFPVANVKLFDTYGPGDRRGKLLSMLDRAADTGQELELSPGEQLIDLLHVDDAVAALRRAAEAASESWQQWSASSGRPLSVRELVDLFATLTGRPVPVAWGARACRPREMFRLWPAGPTVPGWAPRIGLEDGIRSQWCLQR